MRTLLFIVAGLLLAGVIHWLSKPDNRRAAAGLFTIAWLLAVLWNLYTGLSHGYTLAEEAPIQLVIFAVPVAAAWWLAIKRER